LISRSSIAGLALLLICLRTVLALPEPPVKIILENPLEIGRAELLFGSIASICEDDQSNFYVLDRLETRVLKFSPGGRLLAKFGRKGQGPGDFQSPGQIVFTSAGELAVPEDLFYVSFLKPDGTFIRRIDFNGRLGLGYIGPDRFYAWDWRPEGRQQLMVDTKNSILSTFHSQARDLFSVTMPDETGRAVMFNYSNEVYVPQFLFAHGGRLSAVGISDRYEISLLNETGQSAGTLVRDIKRQKFSTKEKDYLKRELQEFAKSKGWPDRVARELGKKIPPFKNMVSAVRVSPQHVFVFRFPQDITAKAPLFPLDVFTLKGEILGTTDLREVPLLVTGKAMYFVKTDEADNVYLLRAGYSLEF
jgi:hypothetical protein